MSDQPLKGNSWVLPSLQDLNIANVPPPGELWVSPRLLSWNMGHSVLTTAPHGLTFPNPVLALPLTPAPGEPLSAPGHVRLPLLCSLSELPPGGLMEWGCLLGAHWRLRGLQASLEPSFAPTSQSWEG